MKWISPALKFGRRVGRHHYADLRGLKSLAKRLSEQERSTMPKASDVPTLRSLSPQYDAGEHGEYVEILKSELAKGGSDAPRNIALTGHYGSGKSSVLTELQCRLLADSVKVINLSLPSLGVGDGRLPEDSAARDKTNLIQKEIVKQLLYRRSPSDTPASRYNRIDTFQTGPAYRRASAIGLASTGIAFLLGLPDKVRKSVPSAFWPWLNKHLWGSPATTLQWLSLLLVFVLAAATALWAQRILQQRLRVTELAAGAGAAKVTLSEPSSSYFDEYLDEIVYFFQISHTSVVIFEDLDRFEDPHIFETLRELNLLLNNADQTGTTPIRFVYAIRDSIFEQLDAEEKAEAQDPDQGGPADDSGRDVAETRRLMATNRTKFFDLVVPMVPFISHRTSRDLIAGALKVIAEKQRPGRGVIDIVSVYLTDMRLIKNICNEYDIFRRRILASDGLKELTPDRLFASIVYKNIYLGDYEKVRHGVSLLDDLYDAYRTWRSQQTEQARTAERVARAQLRRLDAVAARSERLGERLQDVLVARSSSGTTRVSSQITAGGNPYSWADLTTPAFWRSFLDNEHDIVVQDSNVYPAREVPLSFGDIQVLIGEKLSIKDWSEEDRDDLEDAVQTALGAHREAAHGSLTTALAKTEMQFTYEGKQQTLEDVAAKLFDGAPIVMELLHAGFIDENFTLYITQFPGQSISASAMNFIIKAVQPDEIDIEYHFGTTAEGGGSDIEAVLEAEGTRLLGGQSVYNLEIFDHLLASRPDELNGPIERLVANSESDTRFIDAYLTSGKEISAFVAALSSQWPNVFNYLIGQDPEARGSEVLAAALAGANPELTYVMSSAQRGTLTEALLELDAITEAQEPAQATSIARTLEQIGIAMPVLAPVAEPLRNELIKRSLYEVSLPNLRTIVGSDDQLPLDKIKAAYPDDVYPHVLSHGESYLSALDEAKAPTVGSADQFTEVLADVGEENPDLFEETARRAAPECLVADLSALESSLWPPLAHAHRLLASADNVAAYIDQYDADETLADWLSALEKIDPDGASTDVPKLALKLLNTTTLGTETKLRLLSSLALDAGAIGADEITEKTQALLPKLVQEGWVTDDADAFICLGDEAWDTKAALIRSSNAFPAYMKSLSLSTNDLYRISDGDVPDRIKDVLLEDLDQFEGAFGPKGAAALSRWAATTGRTPSPASLQILATKGGAGAAIPIMELLGAQAASIDIQTLRAVLAAIGMPYRALITPGRDRPRINRTAGVAEVLGRLQRSGPVTRIKENDRKGHFEVSKRHS